MCYEDYPKFPLHWTEAFDWCCTNIQHIWLCVQTDKYHFSDETSNFDETGYDTIEEAEEALNYYCENFL